MCIYITAVYIFTDRFENSGSNFFDLHFQKQYSAWFCKLVLVNSAAGALPSIATEVFFYLFNVPTWDNALNIPDL